jgi:hypothetical protein
MSDKKHSSMMVSVAIAATTKTKWQTPALPTKRVLKLLMDEIDGLTAEIKGGINLIKLIRYQKRPKKQKNEQMTMNPVICIGNYYQTKKIKELMKACVQRDKKRPSFGADEKLMSELLPGPSDTTDAEIRKRWKCKWRR